MILLIIDSATIMVQRSIMQYFDKSSEHYIHDNFRFCKQMTGEFIENN